MSFIKFLFLVVCGVSAVAKAQEGYILSSFKQWQHQGNGAVNVKNIEDELIDNAINIPGVAGKDYPNFHAMPQTGFDCNSQLYLGYYADPEANCQMYHICQAGGRKDSFLCANGTIFNQERLVCEWWYTVDCSQAKAKYSINEAITKAMEKVDRITAERKATESFQYKSLSSLVRGEVHDAQQPPQSFKTSEDGSFEKVTSEAPIAAVNGTLGFSSSNYP